MNSFEANLAGLLDKTAREWCDNRIDSFWIHFGMGWLRHTPHRFSVLQQRVLESTARAQKGSTRLRAQTVSRPARRGYWRRG